MDTKCVKIGKVLMMTQAVYALVVSLLWITITEVMFVSIFKGYTGQSISEAIASGSKAAELWLITQRLVGIGLLTISILMIFVTKNGYEKNARWSWFALLIAGTVTWLSLIGYKVATGYFDPSLSSMTFIIGAILFILAITMPAKSILAKKG